MQDHTEIIPSLVLLSHFTEVPPITLVLHPP